MGCRKAGRRVKRRTQKSSDTADDTTDLPPRAFVFTKGKVPAKLKQLVSDLKKVMSPNTATSLRARTRNKLRDFVDVAGSLHVSFFLIVSATAKSAYLRLLRTPPGTRCPWPPHTTSTTTRPHVFSRSKKSSSGSVKHLAMRPAASQSG